MKVIILATIFAAVHGGLLVPPLSLYNPTILHTNRLGPGFAFSPLGAPSYHPSLHPFFYNAPLPLGYPFGYNPGLFGNPFLTPGQAFIPIIPGIIPIDSNSTTTVPPDVEITTPTATTPTEPEPEKIEIEPEAEAEPAPEGKDDDELPESDDTVSVESE